MSKHIKFCPSCNRTGRNYTDLFGDDDKEIVDFNRGYLEFFNVNSQTPNKCPVCNCTEVVDSILTEEEFETISKFTHNRQVLDQMVELKKNNPIDFELKLSQFETATMNKNKARKSSSSHASSSMQTQNVPHCPTCGSTNIQKISDTKRWLTTGLFGLASSDVGKTMVCKKCGYKW